MRSSSVCVALVVASLASACRTDEEEIVDASHDTASDSTDSADAEDGAESESDSSSDAAEGSFGLFEGTSCAMGNLGECAADEYCAHQGSGQCTETPFGYCRPIQTDCGPDPSTWDVCGCGGGGSRETWCEVRQSVVGGSRVRPCIEREGTACDVNDPQSCGADACVVGVCDSEGGWETCPGTCMTVDEVCASGPPEPVCQDGPVTNAFHQPLGPDCWENVCEAYRSGYRGMLSYRD